ncbi:MAG: hypothetical protein PSN34_05610 [Urechidicola sp.]|nr:hypothetical protein [Urechidicola sp.]
MKKILNLIVVFALVLLYSCEYNNSDFDTEDQLTGTAEEGGAIVAVHSSTVGKLLGVPSSLDFETATVSFAEVELYMEVILMTGGSDVSGYEITKSLNNGLETTVASVVSLPITLTYSTVDEFLDGLGVNSDDLRIGDVITFRTKIIRTDGSVEFAGPNDGTYTVVISCSSDMAGYYNLTTERDNGPDALFPNELITEKGVGLYKTESTYRWAVGSIAPDQGLDFTDVCGELTVPVQGLAQGYYSNEVKGTEPGSLDGVTGDFVLHYSVAFSTGTPVCKGTFLAQ